MGKRWIALVLAVAALLCACAAEQVNTQPTQLTQPIVETTEAAVVAQPTVGICLPKEDTFWKKQAELLTKHLEDIGYDTIVQYAAGDPNVQKNQMLELIARQVHGLVITPVDCYTLTEEIREAQKAGIAVVAYDRMPMYTDGVAFCVQPDGYAMGQMLASYIIESQLTEPNQKKTIEFLMGTPDNESSIAFHSGAMEELQPYLDSGALVCRSGRTGFEDVAVRNESAQAAFEQCYDYLDEYYEKNTLDILLCASDVLAEGCIYALEEFPKQLEKGYPLICAAGGDVKAVAQISVGKQAVSLYIDRNQQALQCAKLTYRLLSGEELPEAQLRSNGSKNVKCYDIAPTLVDTANYRQIMMDTGIYAQIQLDEALRPENRPAVSLPTETRPGLAPPPSTKPPVPAQTRPSSTTPEETQPSETTPPETTAPPETQPTLPPYVPPLTLPTS